MTDPQLDEVLATAAAVLRRANRERSPFKPTDFYNEGWMTTLALALAEDGVDLLPFRFEAGASWGREILFGSPFKARRKGDPLAVGTTHADAVVGHYGVRPATKRGVLLDKTATQFVVVEAKIRSPLGKSTRNAADFDQAARSVACMAYEIERAGCQVSQFASLAFCVVSARQHAAGHEPLVHKDSIREKVRTRIEMYDGPARARQEAWYAAYFSPLLERVALSCPTWEDIVGRAKDAAPARGDVLGAFYQECLRLN